MAAPAQELTQVERTIAPLAPFERLLVPVDFSSAARAAFTMAMRMAQQYGSEVIVFNAPGADGNDEFLDYSGVRWGKGDIVGQARGSLKRWADTVVPGSADLIRIEVHRTDDPVLAVKQACDAHQPSLVVLGTHYKSRHRLLRSRSERIVRSVACPVILVRGEKEPRADAD